MNQEIQGQSEEYEPLRGSGFALASFILGFLGLLECVVLFSAALAQQYNGVVQLADTLGITTDVFFLIMLGFAVLGLVLGLIAEVQISRNSSRLQGHSIAQAGVVMSIILFVMVVFLPVFTLRGVSSTKTSCLNNLKQIGTAINMYESDWDDRYPLVSGPGREFERVYGWTYNYRTKSFHGERRWFQNVIGPYAKNKKIFMCPAVGEDQKWRFTDPVSHRSGTVVYAYNRHGGDFPEKDLKRVSPPDGSSTAGLKLDCDPPTSYWFNVCATKPGKPDKVISGRSEEICYKTADAPIVWDTPDGFDNGGGESNLAHEDVINVCYADGHAKPYQIPQTRAPEWLKGDFRLNYGSEGWFPQQ